ncbi:MAG: response regulator, partial [Candidatus Margulisiibacteriota bacterium]
EFKCPQLDQKTFQHIQMLFDPVYEDEQLTRVIGFCRDNGRTYVSDQYKLHWFDSEWLHDLPVLPLEWIVHSDHDCEITTSSFHHHQLKDNVDTFIGELTKHLTELFVQHDYKNNLNISIKFPFSNYHYQLLAAQSSLDPLLWRGFLILIGEKEAPSQSSSLLIQNHEQLLASQSSKLIQLLTGVNDIAEHQHVLKYLSGLSRLSTQAYEFNDFWRQCDDIINQQLFQFETKLDIDQRVRIPYAQWVLSLLPYIFNYFKLNQVPVKISVSEPAVVESHNAHLLEASHVVEIAISTESRVQLSDVDALLFQFALIGSSLDICLSTSETHWKCRIFMEVRAPEQPIEINSQKLYQPVKNLQKKTVLIVDDDEYNTQTLEVLFHSDGFRTISASQGQQALRLIDSLDIIDIIILDLRMPVMDGFGVLDELKASQKMKDTPVMILSANITPNVSERLRGYNVNAIVEKPFDMDDLVGHVNRLIN